LLAPQAKPGIRYFRKQESPAEESQGFPSGKKRENPKSFRQGNNRKIKSLVRNVVQEIPGFPPLAPGALEE
jgi:hypothetical protein